MWDSGQKPNLLAWTRVGWGVECIPGIILFHRYYPSTQRSGLQSSWWLETCLTLRTVHGSCRCGWKPAADRSEKAVTVPSSSGPIQTGKPFTGSTSRQELIKRNWIPASPNSSLIKIVYISVWFPLQWLLGHTKRPFVKSAGGIPGRPGAVNGNGTGWEEGGTERLCLWTARHILASHVSPYSPGCYEIQKVVS